MKHISTITIMLLGAMLSVATLMDGWQAPITLTPEWNDASVPWLAFDAMNNAQLVWRLFDGQYTRIQVANYTAESGTWSAPLTISPVTHAREPKIVVNDAGNAVTTWRLIYGSNFAIMASFFDATTQQWELPFYLPFISDPAYDAEMPDIALNNSNYMMSCWEIYNGSTWMVQAAARNGVSGSWTLPVDLSFSGSFAFSPQVVITDTSMPAVAIVFYGIIENSGIDSVQIVTSPDGGTTWTSPVAISSTGTGAAYVPQIAIDGDDNIIVVWQIQLADGSWTIQARKMLAAEWQSIPDPVSSSNTKNLASGIILNPSRCPNARIAMNRTGQAIMTWFTTVGNAQQVQAVFYDGSDWALWNGSVVTLSDLITPINMMDWPNQRVAIDGNGNGIVVWQEYDALGNQLIHSSVYNNSSTIWTPSTLSLPLQDAALPFIALSDQGQGFAAWKQTDGKKLGNPIYNIQVSQYP